MRYTFCLFAVLAFIWLSNSGHYSPLLLSFGLVSALFVIFIARRMEIVDRESQPLHLWATLPGYYWWLFKKILRSNIEVATCVWRGPRSLAPESGQIPIGVHSDFAKVLYANSITLTPGTVAVELTEGEILVHALTGDGLADLRRGEMENRVKALEN